MEGFTHLIPFAAAHEVLRQGRRHLTLVRMTPDLIYDQLIGMGVADRLVFSWGGNPGVGSLHRLRDAVENGWPQPLRSRSIPTRPWPMPMRPARPICRSRPFAATSVSTCRRSTRGSAGQCPFTGELLAAVPAIRPDVTIIHAQRADRAGNVLLEGIVGVQKQAVLAAKRAIVTVEEIVDELGPPGSNAVVLPAWTVTRHCRGPGRRLSLVRTGLLSACERVLYPLG